MRKYVDNVIYRKPQLHAADAWGGITTDGSLTGPQLLMSAGDSILITIKDSPDGLVIQFNDLTTAQSGFAVATIANGFVQTNAVDCTTTPFAYHPKYSTASATNSVPWTAVQANVSLHFEIGHGELCGDASCSILPDNDADDVQCRTVLGVGVCLGQDLDNDGLSYQPNWPDGSASHPSPLTITNPLNNGVGPLSFFNGSYQASYGSIEFRFTVPPAGTFYPFFSQVGTGRSCVFNFGNEIPGITTDDFGGAGQYGTTINNPCLPRTLTVTSTSRVVIRVIPPDNNGQGDGATPFTRIYDDDTSVTLRAPQLSRGLTFLRWRKDGVESDRSLKTQIEMNADHGVTAVYGLPSIDVIFPNGNEGLSSGAIQKILWSWEGVRADVSIEVSRNSGTDWTTIFTGVANDGNQNWRVTGPATTQARIRIL